MFKESFPRTSQMAVLVNPDNPARGPIIQAIELTAKPLKMGIQQFPVRGPNEFDGAFSAMTQSRVDGVAIIEEPMFQANAGVLAGLATQNAFSRIQGVRGGWRPLGLWSRHSRIVSSRGLLCGQDSQGLSSRRPTRRETHQVRPGHQSQDRQGPRPDDPAVAPAAGGSGD